jgi:hypothetical protein
MIEEPPMKEFSSRSPNAIPVSFGASCADWEDTNSEGLRQVAFQNAIIKAGVSLDDMNAEVQLTLESRFVASEAESAFTLIENKLHELTDKYQEIYRESSRFYSLGGKPGVRTGHTATNYLFVNSARQALFLNVSGFPQGGPQWREERMSYTFHARGPQAFAKDFIDDLTTLLDPYKNQEVNRSDDDVEIHNCVRDASGMISMYQHEYNYPYRWDSMRVNYSEINQSVLSDLVMNPQKFEAGRLIIFYGEPGTGKTWFIRSLVREWYSKYLPIVVQDVESFMSDETYYLNLLQQSDSVNPDNKAPLIILEDAGQSLIRKGDYGVVPIQRLLNRTDGLCVGDRNATFLITFNEDIGDIDAAVLREGRCRASIEFHPLPVSEAHAWLLARNRSDLTELVTAPTSIAQLFGMLRNHGGPTDKSTLHKDQSTVKKFGIGFGA